MSSFVDVSHFTPAVGDRIIRRVLAGPRDGEPADDFGVLLSPQNIEGQTRRLREGRERWASKHHEDLRWVEDLYASARASASATAQ